MGLFSVAYCLPLVQGGEPDAEVADDETDPEFAQREIIRLHNIKILKKIDDGAYGEVFEAKDVVYNEKLAVKRIKMADHKSLPQVRPGGRACARGRF